MVRSALGVRLRKEARNLIEKAKQAGSLVCFVLLDASHVEPYTRTVWQP